MKTLGIIGGFGPEATADFYLSLVKECRRLGLSHQPHVIVWNVPVPKIFEDDLLLRARGQERFKPLLIHAARQLKRIGVNGIVLPCNTLHVFAKAIQQAVHIPFINIIDTALQQLERERVNRVGLLGTSLTIKNALFVRTKSKIEFVLPTRFQQKLLDKGFHQRVVRGRSETLQKALKQIVQAFLRADVHDVLLASTDLHDECEKLPSLCIHDTLQMLAKRTARFFISKHCDIVKGG